jgi:DNA repair exonuclease SbcCD ATPase subunit
MSRERLTRRAADGSIPYPGMVGNEDRKFKKMDEYSNFKQEVNHELPDNRTEWEDNPRDEVGFGIPKEQTGVKESLKHTVAGVRQAASKAVKLAVLLLGEKADEATLETQARAFMAMGPDELDATLDRFASTEHLYVAKEEVEEVEEEKEEVKESSDKLAELQSEIDTLQASFEKQAEEVEEEVEEVKESSDKVAELEAQLASFKEFAAKGEVPPQFLENIKEKKEEKEEKESSETVAEEVSEEVEEEKEAGTIDPEMDEESDKDDDKIGSVDSGLDVELNSVVADYENAPEGEETLASIFDDSTPSQDDLNKLASSKEGIKSLGGQPKVASSKDAEKNIGSIWDDAPDVSSVFQ